MVRALLEEHCPQIADGALTRLSSSGTSNAMWRLHCRDGSQLVVRLPLKDYGIDGLHLEIELLPFLATTPIADLVEIPTLFANGTDAAGRPWAVLNWLSGDDAWTARDHPFVNSVDMAVALAEVVQAIGRCDGVSVPARRPGSRGGSLGPLLDRLEGWLCDPAWSASSLIDVAAVRRVAARCAEAEADTARVPSVLVHGDLIAGNLLVSDGALSAVIDWGGAAIGDIAQDLAPAWSMFDGSARAAFREAMDVDDATWLRAMAFELEHAIGGVLYYVPRRHTLGDVMQRTLDRILAVG